MSFIHSLFGLKTPKIKKRESVKALYMVTLGSHSYSLIAKAHAQSRRLTLKWDSLKKEFKLSHPPRTSQKRIMDFIQKSHSWMIKITYRHPRSENVPKNTISILGITYKFIHDPLRSKGIWRVGENLIIGGFQEGQLCPIIITKFLKDQARLFFTERSHDFADQLGLQIKNITIRDGSTRWGSCSSVGTLSYSWRVILAPLDVATYLCAHEVAHLKEMNHSPNFWAVVARLCPDYKVHRQWLKRNGHVLREMPIIYYGIKKV